VRKTILAATAAASAAAVLAAPGVAGASNGANTCATAAHPELSGTPGQVFQQGRTSSGLNPKAIAGAHKLSVGQLIAATCKA
jgi:hypothetical protein